MSGKIKIAAIVFLQLFFHFCRAQNNELKFNIVEGPNGKPLGKIRNMTQDPHGYMWFSGENEKCIYRYDGTRFTVFRHDDSNPHSLGGTNINSVYADNAGMIWIGMATGFDMFNPATGIFKHYKHIPKDTASLGLNDVAPIIKDRQGRVWIGGSQGLDRFDEKTGKFIHYRNQPGNQKSLSSNFVWTIYEDRQGVIWVGTGFPWNPKDTEDGGLNRLEADGTVTRFMHDPNNPNTLINNKIAAIFEDNRGVFWVGTSGNGLHTMDRKTGIFQRHLYDPKKPGQLSRPPLNPAEGIYDKINFITEDSIGTIWIGTEKSGINRYNPLTKKITYLMHSNGFQDSSGWNAFTSRDGEVWITTESDNLKDKSFNATLKTDFDETIGKLNIIPQDIGRVLLNLYNNAFYALTEKKKQLADGYEPTVSVSTKKNGDKVKILVKDNGNGIPKKVIDKIFQPFYTTKPTGQGTGLGLSLAYDIIKAHRGNISVNTEEGGYTEFVVEL